MGCQGNPYKQLWGRLPTGLPPGRWARRGSGEGRTEVGDHADFGCWAPNLCAPHFREVAWVVPCGRGDQSPVPNLSRAPRSHLHIQDSRNSGKITCKVWCLYDEIPRHRWAMWWVAAVVVVVWQTLERVQWSQSHLWRGGTASWVLASCPSASPWRPGSPGSNQGGRDLGGDSGARIP